MKSDIEVMLRGALELASRQLMVFPLFGKTPAISKQDGGRGYLDATADSIRIQYWWQKYPAANIGIATRGSGLLVLDIDPRHGGNEQLSALEDEHGPLPLTPVVVSGSGGRHIYLLAPESDDVPRRSNALGAGVDLPNYVVAPPSVHPETGRTYKWANLLHPDDIAVAEAPSWLLALLGRKPQQPEKVIVPPPGWLGLIYAAVISEIKAEGGRHVLQRDGGLMIQCPFHDDRSPSLSIHPERGWICFAGCGEGRLTTLAVKLGVSVL